MPSFVWNSRKIVRIFFQSDASFRLHRSLRKEVHLNKKTVSCKLLDLSPQGCALESGIFVPVGSKLNIFVDRNILRNVFQKVQSPRFSKITGMVRSSRQLPNRKYRLGMQFEKISSEDRKLIDMFIDKNNRRQDQRLGFPSK